MKSRLTKRHVLPLKRPAGGTTLESVARAQHFVSDLSAFYPGLLVWQTRLGGAPIPGR
jgi:hypothetical protein